MTDPPVAACEHDAIDQPHRIAVEAEPPASLYILKEPSKLLSTNDYGKSRGGATTIHKSRPAPVPYPQPSHMKCGKKGLPEGEMPEENMDKHAPTYSQLAAHGFH